MSITSADTPLFSGSPILGESPPFPSSSRTGPGGADLSLSELYISDRSEHVSPPRPFSLLPQRENDEGHSLDNEDDVFNEGNERDADEGDVTVTASAKRSQNVTRTREECLQHDLFVLKKLNTSFAAYNEALKDTTSSAESVAIQLERTDWLLDRYISLMQHTEKNSKLIFDESWQGGGADQEILEKMRVEAEERTRREREERERAAQLERERQVREEEERRAREKEAREKDKRSAATIRGIRGSRGLRARGSERGTSIVTRGRVPSTSTQGLRKR